MVTSGNKKSKINVKKWIRKLISHVLDPERRELTVTAEQHPASPVQGPSLEAYCVQTNHSLLMIPGLKFHKIIVDKEEQTSRLVKEKGALLEDIKQLKQFLETKAKAENLQQGFLKAELSKEAQSKREDSLKIQLLEKTLEAERAQRQKMEGFGQAEGGHIQN